MLSSLWADPPGSRFARVPWLGRVMDRVERGIDWMHRFYGALLAWALSHRKSVLAIAFVTFVGSFAIVPLVGTEFIPEADQGFISLRLNRVTFPL
jgi:multidrug efflux pump subunit AcrB